MERETITLLLDEIVKINGHKVEYLGIERCMEQEVLGFYYHKGLGSTKIMIPLEVIERGDPAILHKSQYRIRNYTPTSCTIQYLPPAGKEAKIKAGV